MTVRVVIAYILSVIFSSVAIAQATEEFSLMPEQSYDTEKTMEKPVGTVNDQGNIEWKYPPGYFEKQKEEMRRELEEKKKKEIQAEREKLKKILEAKKKEMDEIKKRSVASEGPNFIPGPNKGQFIKGTVHLLGYYYGANLASLWQEDQWSYGVQGKVAIINNPDTNSTFTTFAVMALTQYHFFPRWYTSSPKEKFLDPYAFLSLGGASTTKNTGEVGVAGTTGLGASYGLTSNVKAFGEYEIFYYKELSGLSGSYSLGIIWEY